MAKCIVERQGGKRVGKLSQAGSGSTHETGDLQEILHLVSGAGAVARCSTCCRYWTGNQIMSHNIIFTPKLHHWLSSQPASNPQALSKWKFGYEFCQIKHIANKQASLWLLPLCPSQTEMCISCNGLFLPAAEKFYWPFYRWDCILFFFFCPGNFRVELAKVLGEGVSMKTWEKINLSGNPWLIDRLE